MLTHSLKRKCRHFDEILITGCTGSCHFDNFQCSQWWKFHQNEDISVSVLMPEQNSCQFVDNCKWISVKENWCIFIKFSLKLIIRGPIDNKTFYQVMAWQWICNKTLPEPMMTQLTDTWMHHQLWDKMGTIFQTTFSNGFSWMKMYEFRLKFQVCSLGCN